MLKSIRTTFVLLSLCVAWLSLLSTAWAQSDRGSLTGTVTDSSKSVMIGVSVTVTNLATGVKAMASTNESGNYTILFLGAGSYTLTAERAGFKQYSRYGVNVRGRSGNPLGFQHASRRNY